MLAELEKDLDIVVKALEQSLANHNVLIGQKQGIEHVIAKIKSSAVSVEKTAETVEKVADTAETVVEAIPG